MSTLNFFLSTYTRHGLHLGRTGGTAMSTTDRRETKGEQGKNRGSQKMAVCIVRTLLLWAGVVGVWCGSKETTGGGGMWTIQARSCGRSPFPLWSLHRVCTFGR